MLIVGWIISLVKEKQRCHPLYFPEDDRISPRILAGMIAYTKWLKLATLLLIPWGRPCGFCSHTRYWEKGFSVHITGCSASLKLHKSIRAYLLSINKYWKKSAHDVIHSDTLPFHSLVLYCAFYFLLHRLTYIQWLTITILIGKSNTLYCNKIVIGI